MKERIAQNTVYHLQPALLNHLVPMAKAAQKNLDPSLFRLLTIRCSQLNGCGFCLHMHLAEARQLGESQDRLDLLCAWRELPIYNARERAALNWAEKITLVAQGGVTDDDFSAVSAEFSEEEIVNLTTAIVTINSWNRIAIGCGFIPTVA